MLRITLALLAVTRTALAATPAEIEKRIDDLLGRMTLDEKIGQMSQQSMNCPMSDKTRDEIRKGRWGSFLNACSPAERAEAQRIALNESRLRIPLIFGRDVIHGYRTVFPIPLGQSASWNPDLVRDAARIAALEASSTGIHWTFAPMIDITRDPRWGRIAETLGEDPYLTSALGAAMVRGFQGTSIDAVGSLAACAKHYVGYGAAEAGRDYNTTWIPENLLRDVFLPPFKAAHDAGVATYMSAFNSLNGVPTSGNPFTLTQVLRNEWKFDGFVVSDWESVTEMIAHGYAAGPAEAALKATRAGVDMEMVSQSYWNTLKQHVASGAVPQATIDTAVRNILRVKLRMGLFDKPVPATKDEPTSSEEALRVARRAALESFVLLRNEKDALPLAKNIKRLAVIGPLADAPVDQMGAWVMDARREEVQTPVAALRRLLGPERLTYVQALKNSRDTARDGFGPALEAARAADAVVLILGEEQILSGEAHSRAFLNLPGAQEALVDEIAKAGKPVITVIMAGRPLIFDEVAAKSAAVLYAWHPGTMGGPALADVLFGDAAPSGRLTVSFPRAVGQIPIYYNAMSTGRPAPATDKGIPTGTPLDPVGYTSRYLDVDVTPQYPFGFGLTYTTFEYSNLRVSAAAIARDGRLTVSADVRNTGKREAAEVAQLYVRDLVGSVTRPVRELKGFRKVTLKPGEQQTVQFTVTPDDLAFHLPDGKRIVEPGRFHVWVAPNAAAGLQGEFELK